MKELEQLEGCGWGVRKCYVDKLKSEQGQFCFVCFLFMLFGLGIEEEKVYKNDKSYIERDWLGVYWFILM